MTQFDASILGSQIAGEVKNFDATKYLGVKEVRRFDRFVHFGVAAGIMALEDAGIEVTEELAPEIGVANRRRDRRHSRHYVELSGDDRPRSPPQFRPS